MGSKHLLLRFLLGCGGGTVTPSPPGKGGAGSGSGLYWLQQISEILQRSKWKKNSRLFL